MPFPFPKSGYTPPIGGQIDKRNFIYEKAVAPQPFPTSYKTDLSAIPVFNQLRISDCVENAITLAKKYHTYKATGTIVDLCRRFLAIKTVQADGFPIEDGTSIQKALYIAYKQGICETAFFSDNHALDPFTFIDQPIPDGANANALNHKIESYAFLSDLSVNGLKNAINQNGIVLVGALINQNWWTDQKGNTSWNAADILPIRPPKTHDPKIDQTLSGHLFVLYGYDEEYFYFRNSFGNTWGNGGDGYFKIDEVPFIYEAATIVDLTAEQIAQLKTVQVQIQQVSNDVPKVTTPQEISALQMAIIIISEEISRIFSFIKRG